MNLPVTTAQATPPSASELADELLLAGAISRAERDAMVDAARRDVLQDRTSALGRTQANPFPSPTPSKPTTQENHMDPRAIIKSIEENRSVMEAQLTKLGEISAAPPKLTLGDGDTPDTVANLLKAAVRGHLQGAAASINAMAEVEQTMRAAKPPPAHTAHPKESEIIDVEFVAVPTKKE